MNYSLKKISILIFLIILLSLLNTGASAIDLENGYVLLAYSDDSQYAVKSTDDNSIYYFDSGKSAIPWSHNIGRYIGSVAITSDGKYVAVGSASGLIYLFDQNGNILWKRTFGDSVIKSVAFTQDGQHIDASNIFNQAYYITLNGNLAPRQISPSGSNVPTVVPSVTPTQQPSDSRLLDTGSSLDDNEKIILLIIFGLCIAVLIWLYLARHQNRHQQFIALCKKGINLKNLTILSLLIIAGGLITNWCFPSQYTDLTNGLFFFGVLGLIITYFLYSVSFWSYDNKFIATFMLAIPLCVYHFSTNSIEGSINSIFLIFIVIAIYAILSAIILYISEKIRAVVLNNVLKNKRRRYIDFPPKISFIIVGIVVISLIMMSFGSSAILSDNVNSALKSTTNYASSSQYSPLTPETSTYSITPVQTTQTRAVTIPLPTKNLETGLTSRSFDYVLRGRTSSINLKLYSGVYSEITSKESPYGCIRHNYDTSPCTSEEIRQYYLKFIDEPNQKKYLDSLVQFIESTSSNKDDRARIAISLVQQIPYDYSRLYAGSFKMRTPYEVLYDNKGVCSEKSVLLAYLLRELGYGVVLFEFPTQNHMAIGIKSPSQYDFKNTGYAFIESAAPAIPTDAQGDYVGVGKLTSSPSVLLISNGNSFDTISEEYQDAQRYNTLINMGPVLDQYSYSQWGTLIQKYGLDTV